MKQHLTIYRQNSVCFAQRFPTDSVQSELCEQHYHLRCCGVAYNNVSIALNLAAFTGWTCRSCRSSLRLEVDKLRSDLETLRAARNDLPHVEPVIQITREDISPPDQTTPPPEHLKNQMIWIIVL